MVQSHAVAIKGIHQLHRFQTLIGLCGYRANGATNKNQKGTYYLQVECFLKVMA